MNHSSCIVIFTFQHIQSVFRVIRPGISRSRGSDRCSSLPSYSPDLNPNEFMNGDLKMKMSASETTLVGPEKPAYPL
jgi:hypothetical protein